MIHDKIDYTGINNSLVTAMLETICDSEILKPLDSRTITTMINPYISNNKVIVDKFIEELKENGVDIYKVPVSKLKDIFHFSRCEYIKEELVLTWFGDINIRIPIDLFGI